MACAGLIANKSKEISRLNSVYVNLLKNAGVAYYEGKGSLLDAHTVQVGSLCTDLPCLLHRCALMLLNGCNLC